MGQTILECLQMAKTLKISYERRDMFPNPIMHFMGNQIIMSTLLPLRYDVG
jgi:hypothetical protein